MKKPNSQQLPIGPCRFVILHYPHAEPAFYELLMEWGEEEEFRKGAEIRCWRTRNDSFPDHDSIIAMVEPTETFNFGLAKPLDEEEEAEGHVLRVDGGIARVKEDRVDETIVFQFLGRRMRGFFGFEPFTWEDGNVQIRLVRKNEAEMPPLIGDIEDVNE